jgi:hypothetical protein
MACRSCGWTTPLPLPCVAVGLAHSPSSRWVFLDNIKLAIFIHKHSSIALYYYRPLLSCLSDISNSFTLGPVILRDRDTAQSSNFEPKFSLF